MRASNNPTTMSAVVGTEEAPASATRTAVAVQRLVLPALLAAFAVYLVVGIITMQVPPGAAFPGPGYFPGIIAAVRRLRAPGRAHGGRRAGRAAGAAAGGAPTADAGAEPVGTAPVAGDGTDAEPLDAVAEEGDRAPLHLDWRACAWVVGSFVAFILLLEPLGWVLSAGLLYWGVTRGFGARQGIAGPIVGLTVSSLAYIAFDMALGMPLPSGVLGWGS